ncbi:MAG: hypothetical protein ACLU38_14905 [Dysosmobacter sp.]
MKTPSAASVTGRRQRPAPKTSGVQRQRLWPSADGGPSSCWGKVVPPTAQPARRSRRSEPDGAAACIRARSEFGAAPTPPKQFVVGVPVQDGGQTIGMVLAVMNARSVMGIVAVASPACSLMTSAIILLCRCSSSPPRPPCGRPSPSGAQHGAGTHRAYAPPELSTVVMQDFDRGDGVDELAAGSSNMADSLAGGQTSQRQRDFIANISHELKISP